MNKEKFIEIIKYIGFVESDYITVRNKYYFISMYSGGLYYMYSDYIIFILINDKNAGWDFALKDVNDEFKFWFEFDFDDLSYLNSIFKKELRSFKINKLIKKNN